MVGEALINWGGGLINLGGVMGGMEWDLGAGGGCN